MSIGSNQQILHHDIKIQTHISNFYPYRNNEENKEDFT